MLFMFGKKRPESAGPTKERVKQAEHLARYYQRRLATRRPDDYLFQGDYMRAIISMMAAKDSLRQDGTPDTEVTALEMMIDRTHPYTPRSTPWPIDPRIQPTSLPKARPEHRVRSKRWV